MCLEFGTVVPLTTERAAGSVSVFDVRRFKVLSIGQTRYSYQNY